MTITFKWEDETGWQRNFSVQIHLAKLKNCISVLSLIVFGKFLTLLIKCFFLFSFQKIAEHNSKGHSYTLAMNQFGDLTHNEYQFIYLGMRGHFSTERKRSGSTYMPPSHVTLPEEVDWRQEGYVTPVKNQGMRVYRLRLESKSSPNFKLFAIEFIVWKVSILILPCYILWAEDDLSFNRNKWKHFFGWSGFAENNFADYFTSSHVDGQSEVESKPFVINFETRVSLRLNPVAFFAKRI